MSTDVSRHEWNPGELGKLSFRQLNALDGTPGLTNMNGTGDKPHRLTCDTVVTATERHTIPLGDEGGRPGPQTTILPGHGGRLATERSERSNDSSSH